MDQRVIKCKVTHSQRTFDPFTIVTIYAPAQLAKRLPFFSRVIKMLIMCFSENIPTVNLTSSNPILPTRTIITGDFDYTLRDVSTTFQGPRSK
ncbi:hypothetical protein INT47_006893 [Mucor saturninus]|uniref:Uncharacterized protein n=1 Tax=Mucor saturninus TaxID=64648 RepID=A0A8H7RCW9_9FUNG|nr:hypothetical protein INT47_006893 [Mucor saturninus]